MTKQELTPYLGKYIQIIFTLHSKRLKASGYFELYGTILTIEDKNIEFKDNYNHLFIIPTGRIKAIEEQTESRHTEEEYQLKLIREVNKAQGVIRKKTKEIEDKEPLITLHL